MAEDMTSANKLEEEELAYAAISMSNAEEWCYRKPVEEPVETGRRIP